MTEYSVGTYEKDSDDIIELCGSWWEDSLFYKLYGIKYEVDRKFFEALKDYGLLLLCGRDNGKLVSCYVGIKTPYMFNPSVMTASEIVWCIRKENRSYRELIGLMRAINDLMASNNIKLWNLAVSNEEKYLPTTEFLERQGYKFMDRCYSFYKDDNSKGEENG